MKLKMTLVGGGSYAWTDGLFSTFFENFDILTAVR